MGDGFNPGGWGQRVAGRCPSCRGEDSLFVAQGQHVTCSRVECPNPTAVDEQLNPGPLTLHAHRLAGAEFSHTHPKGEIAHGHHGWRYGRIIGEVDGD